MKTIIRFLGPLASLAGWMFIAIAVLGPFTQLKEIELAQLTIIKYLEFGVGEDVWGKFGSLIGYLLTPIVFGAPGVALIVYGRRAWIMNEWKKVLRDKSDIPVVYLRAFHSDDVMSSRGILRFSIQSEEEQLVESLREVGPVYAIGKPGEMLPLLGATRVYIDDNVWQEEVSKWFQSATLVVIRLSPSPSLGVQWELETCLRLVPLEHLVFLIPKNVERLDWFNEILLKQNLPALSIPNFLNSVYGSVNSGIAYFNDDKILDFAPLRKPPLLRRPFTSPMVVVYRLAFRTIITRTNKTRMELPWAFGEVFFRFFLILIFLLPAVLAFWLTNAMTPYAKESMKMNGRLSKNHPEIRPEDFEKNIANGNYLVTLRRMSDGDLLSWLRLQERLLHGATSQECAAILNGTLQFQGKAMEDFLNRIAEFDEVFMHSWFVFLEKFIIESSKVSRPNFNNMTSSEFRRLVDEFNNRMTDAEYEQLWEEFINGMSPEVRNRYQSSDGEADACWVQRAAYVRLIEMGDAKGSKLARALLK